MSKYKIERMQKRILSYKSEVEKLKTENERLEKENGYLSLINEQTSEKLKDIEKEYTESVHKYLCAIKEMEHARQKYIFEIGEVNKLISEYKSKMNAMLKDILKLRDMEANI